MDTTPRIRAVIADDEALLATDLAERLQAAWPALEIVALAHDGPAALAALHAHAPELAFLDIRMPGLSGLEVAQACRVPHLVFVTAYDQYAVSAFEAAAADYLLKPLSDERLRQAVARLRARIASAQPAADLSALLQQLLPHAPHYLKWIRAGIGADIHLVDIASVLYFRADDKYTVVQTNRHEYLIRTPLKELLPQLDPQAFWQIHRNTLVATTAIASAHRELTGRVSLSLRERPETLSVSRAFAHLFKQM
jgi:DNA-binding LytR/AlgR family response regulator